jgi:hypothetical protein
MIEYVKFYCDIQHFWKYPSRYIVIATTNVKHLGEFTEALNWEEINL